MAGVEVFPFICWKGRGEEILDFRGERGCKKLTINGLKHEGEGKEQMRIKREIIYKHT